MPENELSFEIIGAAMKFIGFGGPDFWNLLMQNVFAVNSDKGDFIVIGSSGCRCDIKNAY